MTTARTRDRLQKGPDRRVDRTTLRTYLIAERKDFDPMTAVLPTSV
jgi:hypothetical protein